MGRKRRLVELGGPHHVVHRGNHGQQLFRSDSDRRYYLALVFKHSRLTRTEIGGFCLMDNHVHLIAVPSVLRGVSDCVGRAHKSYSDYLNREKGTHGANWEGRYFCVSMDGPHTTNALRYVERNPVAAGLVKDARAWYWSSAAMHCGVKPIWPIVNVDPRPEWIDPGTWADMLDTPLDETELQTVKWAAYEQANPLDCQRGHAALVPPKSKERASGNLATVGAP